jgi:hypothetical protein
LAADVSLLPDRMLEQVETWTAWDRRAWEPGSILRLRELSEASAWVQEGVLSDGSLGWLRRSLEPLIGQDPGLGQGAVQNQLRTLLKDRLVHGSQAQRRLNHLIDFTSETYLDAWRAALTDGRPIDVERASRFITGHILDAGYHAEHVRLRTKALLRDGADPVAIIDEYREMHAAPNKSFGGFVALLRVPEPDLLRRATNWIDQEEVARRLRSRDVTGFRQVGGLHFTVPARDVRAATAVVAEMVDRLVSRTRFLRGKQTLQYHPRFFADDGTDYALVEARPEINVMALVKNGVLYSASLTDRRSNAVDDALELASQLMDGPATVAAAGGWAALESLLVTGADNSREVGRAVAADRAAALVAASWPRAELTRMSYRAAASADCPARLKAGLDDAGDESIQRCEVLLDWLEARNPLGSLEPRDQAALSRLEALVANSKPVLNRVQSYLGCSLRRLYRQRNLVLHGGSIGPVALSSTIRTSGPLVGATLDRLSHAFELLGVDPLDAVARAECALKAVGDTDGWRLHNLAVA